MTEPGTLTPLSIREAGSRMRRGALTSVELVEAALTRIEQTEDRVHAYVAVAAEEARVAAARADMELQAGNDRGLLHGIPIAVKDIFDWAAIPTGCGSRARDGCEPAVADAETVARLRARGAVLLGKTVTQEFAAGVVSPPARNPWNVHRVPGGSSGGSAVAVASGSCRAALGSDTGGSIRIPAAVCGVVGLKPTVGLVSTRGVYPLSWSLDTVGPLARTVEDAAVVLDALGADRPMSVPSNATSELGQDVAGLRIGVPRPYFFDRVHPQVQETINVALDELRRLGATLVETPWAEAAAARASALIISRVESASVHETTLRDAEAGIGPDLRQRLLVGRRVPATEYVRALRARVVVRDAVSRLFASHRLDALATPTVPAVAVPADRLVVEHSDGPEPLGAAYTRLTVPFNATGQPALSVPCGFDESGLPVGLQLVGRPFAEATLCRIGHAYEQTTRWHLRLPPI
ncbi:MAG: amidase [Chloroflexota bacterium]|nr:amidase [Chloroflexota bacterium]